MGAFAFFCPILFTLCGCTIAQLLGLAFPPLPVFASGGWGMNVEWVLLEEKSHNPQADSGVFGFCLWGWLRVWLHFLLLLYHYFFCFVFILVYACLHIFILASLIRMPLAGSCPNRGCHLIKSIICWLNLLELRRKRSVPTLSHSVCPSLSLSLYPSLTHSRAGIQMGEKQPTEIHN